MELICSSAIMSFVIIISSSTHNTCVLLISWKNLYTSACHYNGLPRTEKNMPGLCSCVPGREDMVNYSITHWPLAKSCASPCESNKWANKYSSFWIFLTQLCLSDKKHGFFSSGHANLPFTPTSYFIQSILIVGMSFLLPHTKGSNFGSLSLAIT